jgi:hypothetical protein
MIVLCRWSNVGIVTAASHLMSLYHARSGQTLNMKSHVRKLESYDDACCIRREETLPSSLRATKCVDVENTFFPCFLSETHAGYQNRSFKKLLANSKLLFCFTEVIPIIGC